MACAVCTRPHASAGVVLVHMMVACIIQSVHKGLRLLITAGLNIQVLRDHLGGPPPHSYPQGAALCPMRLVWSAVRAPYNTAKSVCCINLACVYGVCVCMTSI